MPQLTLEKRVASLEKQVAELLNLNRWETDGFLKNAQAFRAHESDEFSSDLERLRSLSK